VEGKEKTMHAKPDILPKWGWQICLTRMARSYHKNGRRKDPKQRLFNVKFHYTKPVGK